jgi:uncharacterized membrane protein YjjP (DUF1212 family)
VQPAGSDAALTQAVDALIEFGTLMLRTGTEAFRVRQRMGELARAMGIDALVLHVLLGSIEVTARRGSAHVTLVNEIAPLGIDAGSATLSVWHVVPSQGSRPSTCATSSRPLPPSRRYFRSL